MLDPIHPERTKPYIRLQIDLCSKNEYLNTARLLKGALQVGCQEEARQCVSLSFDKTVTLCSP